MCHPLLFLPINMPLSHWLSSFLILPTNTPLLTQAQLASSPSLQSLFNYQMTQTLSSSRTTEILARYRPIAPKPPDHGLTDNSSNTISKSKIRDSPYMRSVWRPNYLQARPTRTRKRGRPTRTRILQPTYAFSPRLSPKNLSSFLASPNVFDLDLNMHVPVEKDLLQQLQAKEVQVQAPGIVTPRPLRLVSSAITIQPGTISNLQEVAVQGPSKASEIEEKVESEALPTVISDSKNRIRLANSAYNKLVGQPQCCWLDPIAKAVTCSKICGEVMLRLPDSAGEEFASTSNGFYCLVVLEWGNSENKSSITTFGESVRLSCESRDYMFAWRFHTQGAVTSAPNF